MNPQTSEKPPRPTVKALLARVERLEKDLEISLDIERGVRDDQTIRNVHSIGMIVDYLVIKGLIDSEELKHHVRLRCLALGMFALDWDEAPMLDIHDWIIWAETNLWRHWPVTSGDPDLVVVPDTGLYP